VQSAREGVVSTFGAICGTEPTFIRECEPEPCNGIIGTISFVGDFSWGFALHLPKQTAIALSQMFAGFEIDYGSSDMGDVVGELANVVAGDVAARLERDNIVAQMSLPTVTRGREVETVPIEGQTHRCLQFETEQGGFFVLVSSSTGAC
jgi:CheY-specific phosphatase CheX